MTARGGGSNLSSTWGPPKLVCARGGCGTALLCGVCVAAAARIREFLVRGAAHFWLCARRRWCHIFGCARGGGGNIPRIWESLARGAAHFWLCARRRRCHIFCFVRAAAAAAVVIIKLLFIYIFFPIFDKA